MRAATVAVFETRDVVECAAPIVCASFMLLDALPPTSTGTSGTEADALAPICAELAKLSCVVKDEVMSVDQVDENDVFFSTSRSLISVNAVRLFDSVVC